MKSDLKEEHFVVESGIQILSYKNTNIVMETIQPAPASGHWQHQKSAKTAVQASSAIQILTFQTVHWATLEKQFNNINNCFLEQRVLHRAGWNSEFPVCWKPTLQILFLFQIWTETKKNLNYLWNKVWKKIISKRFHFENIWNSSLKWNVCFAINISWLSSSSASMKIETIFI